MANHQSVKGIILLLLNLAAIVCSGGLLGPVVWLFALVDTIVIARRLLRGEVVSKWRFF